MPSFTAGELAERVGARLEGDPGRRIEGVAPVASARPSDLTFLVDSGDRRNGLGTPGAVLLEEDVSPGIEDATLLRVASPQLAFAELLPLFHPEGRPPEGVHPSAVVAADAVLGDEVSVGPLAVIEGGVHIGDGTTIGALAYVARGATIGSECRVADTVSVLGGARLGDRVRVHSGTRIGTDGYGFAPSSEGARRIPQVGACVIGDDVEIGANCTIDRGALADTTIGARTKIDNLVHIAHNVTVGEDCMIVAQVGIAGSSRVARGAQLGGQAGISGHLTVGAGARIGAQAGVISDVPAGAMYSGYPARPHQTSLRGSAALLKLPAALRRLGRLERHLGLSGDEAEDGGKEAPD